MPALPRSRVARGTSAAATALLLALAWLSPRAIPFCMDEFVHYHALGCAVFPLNAAFNTFREGCGRYDLRLPGTSVFLPLRSYHYIGSLPALVFWPFWRLIGSPVAVRVQGAILLLLASWGTARLVGVSFGAALLAGLVYPVYALAFLVDLGPVGLSLLALLGALGLTRAATREPSQSSGLALAAAAGLAAFVGLWLKLVFVWCLPALALFGLAGARRQQGASRSRLVARALALGGAFLLPSLLLLFSRDREGELYLGVSRDGHVGLGARDWPALVRLGHYLIDGSAVLPRTLTLPELPLDALPAILAAALLLGGALLARGARRRIALWLAMGLATFATSLVTRSVWGPHHVAFSLFFLAGALAVAIDALGRTRPWLLGLALALGALFWASLAWRLPAAAIHDDTDFDKDRLLAFVREEGLDAHDVVVHVNWGTYYISHLFGSPQQLVLFVERFPNRPDELTAVRALAERLGRGVLVVTLREPRAEQMPPLRAALGDPRWTRRFGRWWLYEYLR